MEDGREESNGSGVQVPPVGPSEAALPDQDLAALLGPEFLRELLVPVLVSERLQGGVLLEV